MESKNKEIQSMKKTQEEREEVKQLFGYIPLLNVEKNGRIIGIIEVNANLSVGYLDEYFFESEGIIKLENGKLVYIEHIVGMIDTKIISEKEAMKLIQKNQTYYLLPKLELEAELQEEQYGAIRPLPRVYEVEVYYGERAEA